MGFCTGDFERNENPTINITYILKVVSTKYSRDSSTIFFYYYFVWSRYLLNNNKKKKNFKLPYLLFVKTSIDYSVGFQTATPMIWAINSYGPIMFLWEFTVLIMYTYINSMNVI